MKLADNFTDVVIQNLSGKSQLENDVSKIAQNVDEFTKKFEKFFKDGIPSQGAARDEAAGMYDSNKPFGQHHANFGSNRKRPTETSFADSFEKSLLESLGSTSFKNRLKGSLNKFADALGVELSDLPNGLGGLAGKLAANSFKSSAFGKKYTAKSQASMDKWFGQEGQITSILNNLKNNPNATLKDAAQALKGVDFSGFAGTIAKTASFNAALGIASIGLKLMGKQLGEIKEAFKGLLNEVGKSYTKEYALRAAYIESANERLQADIRVLVEEPFAILKRSAEEVYQAWDQNVRLIGATQGYSKADLQDLMSAYAARLTSEGLSNVIASTDVYNSLAKVIQSGLSGNAAVEFAYQATKLNAAIPTQDFFNYVEAYSSVAANAIAAGKSETEALDMANKSLEEFSNNLLYASRNLVGGYATGLRSSGDIYSSAVKIAQAARSSNITGLASSLLAVQGYVGSIAPDLATNLSDKIYSLATGGNAEDIVALRSLAGINASNTEFLRALSANPQAVLSTMFANLGKMFSQSPDAYMEKAAGYASLFGLSPEAFQRIDFTALANAIINMSSTSDSLKENINLLKSGETTTSADQLKIAQINKYMIEEGLAYVIDNEAARMIQEHMWQEQQTRELTSSTYSVEIVGNVAKLIEKILSAVGKAGKIIEGFLTLGIGPLLSYLDTRNEQAEMKNQISAMLEQNKVGAGSELQKYQLTHTNASYNLTKSIREQLIGSAAQPNLPEWAALMQAAELDNAAGILAGSPSVYEWAVSNQTKYDLMARNAAVATGARLPASRYVGFGGTSKEQALAALSALSAGGGIIGTLVGMASGLIDQTYASSGTGAASTSATLAASKLSHMLSSEYINEFVRQGKSYSDWQAAARGQGVTDIDAAIDQLGYTSEQVQEYFESFQLQAGVQRRADIAEQEARFREVGLSFFENRFWNEYTTPLTSHVTSLNDTIDDWKVVQLDKIQQIIDGQVEWRTQFIGESGYFTKFFEEFMKTFVEHTYYNSGYTYDDVLSVQRQEKEEQGSAVYALAEALTGNFTDLKNPTLQTNAILAQILVVVSAIMNQNNNVAGTVSLADTLSSLALGLTQTTPMNETPVRS